MFPLGLVLVSFVGLCACDRIQNELTDPLGISPEKQVALLKQMVKIGDEQIIQRWWQTEELTCKEVENVLETMRTNMESDLSLLMADVKKHLLPQIPPLGRKKARCLSAIREDLEDAIKDGIDQFSTCTATSSSIQDQNESGMHKNREKYENSIKYTLENLDRCLEHSNINSKVHRNKCVKQMLDDNVKNIRVASDTFNKSRCMAHFTNTILDCSVQVVEKINTKKRELQNEIYDCLGYTYLNTLYDNFGEELKLIFSNFADGYRNLNDIYEDMVLDSFNKLYKLSVNQEEGSEKYYYDKLRKRYQVYFATLNRALEENRSEKERECTNEAIFNLDNLLEEGSKDLAECHAFVVRERVEDITTLNNTLTEFNKLLPNYGNVALLRCLQLRPQHVFGANAIDKCAVLVFKTLLWELELVDAKLSKTLRKPQQTYPLLLPDEKTCGPLREKKLELDIEKNLYECTKCLYGLSGDYYAVTISPTITLRPSIPSDETTRALEFKESTQKYYTDEDYGEKSTGPDLQTPSELQPVV